MFSCNLSNQLHNLASLLSLTISGLSGLKSYLTADLHLSKASAKCASGHPRKFEDAMAGAGGDSATSLLKGTAECQHWQEAQHSDMPLKN